MITATAAIPAAAGVNAHGAGSAQSGTVARAGHVLADGNTGIIIVDPPGGGVIIVDGPE